MKVVEKTYDEWLRSYGLLISEQRSWGKAPSWPAALHDGREGAALSSAVWWLQQDSREWHGAVSGEGQLKVRKWFLLGGWSCVVLIVGLDYPYGSLPTWGILWFCATLVKVRVATSKTKNPNYPLVKNYIFMSWDLPCFMMNLPQKLLHPDRSDKYPLRSIKGTRFFLHIS